MNKCTSNHHGSRNLQEFNIRTTTLWEKRETFFDYKKAKNRIFPKGLTHAFGPKSANFYFVSVKTRLVIVLLNDFVEKKETFLSIKKKKNFPNSKKSHFSKGVNPCL